MSNAEQEVIVGIDLGTTNSLVGVVDSGFPIILADQAGHRMLPSVVQFPADDSGAEVIVGLAARNSQVVHPERTVSSIKRFIGRSANDVSTEEMQNEQLSRTGSDGLLVAGKTPEKVSAEILSELKKTAEYALEQPVSRAVITVPAYFNNTQREATKKAAELAGWKVERIINEPTAAALAYGLDREGEEQLVAVYDLGGGTFDLSILQLKEGLFEVIATAGDTELGGDDIDQAVAEFFLSKMELQKEDLESSQWAELLRIGREAKEYLSENEAYDVRLPFFREGKSWEFSLTAEQLELLADPILLRTKSICQRAFAEAEAKGKPQIDQLLMVGGSTRMPLIARRLKEWFGKEPQMSGNPDEAVALGAAIQAGILCGRVRNVVLVDVTPLSLGIETFGGLMNVIIPRNSTIPAKAGEMFTNAVANQESLAIRVLQGEREMARDNWQLGEIEVPFTPGPKGSARVGVQFTIDQDGILEVLSRDTSTGEDHILEIRNAAVDVDDEAVEKMVEESIDFAFEDMSERIWTEAEMKSRELLPAVEAALTVVGEEITDSEKLEIEAAASDVASLLELPENRRDVNALKAANQKLDDATQTLAAILVEKALDEAL